MEVAEHTFVPAASALLADWGAEVVKIEPIERGDAMRGLASSGVVSIGGGVHALLEHSNRGKRSLALDLSTPEGLEILYKLVATADPVFLTNKLPRRNARSSRLSSRTLGPTTRTSSMLRARGRASVALTPQGFLRLALVLVPDRDLHGVRTLDSDRLPNPPGPGFGDSIGAMTIAGGIMGAIFHRERTGEATTVDVSLLGRRYVGHGSRPSHCHS